MERYNYHNNVKEDFEQYVRNYISNNEITSGKDLKTAAQDIYDEAFVSDEVTGNGSGSYFFDSYKAEEAICHNFDLLADALDEFGDEPNILRKGAESCDVIIRCYMLGQIYYEVIEKIANELYDGGNIVSEYRGRSKNLSFSQLKRLVNEGIESGRMTKRELEELGCEVEEMLRKHDISARFTYADEDDQSFTIKIEGEWTNEHTRADRLVKEKYKEYDIDVDSFVDKPTFHDEDEGEWYRINHIYTILSK